VEAEKDGFKPGRNQKVISEEAARLPRSGGWHPLHMPRGETPGLPSLPEVVGGVNWRRGGWLGNQDPVSYSRESHFVPQGFSEWELRTICFRIPISRRSLLKKKSPQDLRIPWSRLSGDGALNSVVIYIYIFIINLPGLLVKPQNSVAGHCKYRIFRRIIHYQVSKLTLVNSEGTFQKQNSGFPRAVERQEFVDQPEKRMRK
jgi:hypothetical protein